MLWLGFIAAHTGKFGLGESDHDMGHNLYGRVLRISGTLQPAQKNIVREALDQRSEEGSLGVIEYLRFGMEYPVPFIKHAIRDIAIFVGKSGVERLFIDYFELHKESRSQLQNSRSSTGWRARLERDGPAAAISYLWQTQGTVLVHQSQVKVSPSLSSGF